jgi:Meckel syndrome type 1 protein
MSQQITESELAAGSPEGEHDAAVQSVAMQPRTYRGSDLREILPRIRAELGPDAVVTCQREGLVGGVGGFFAKRFVEIEAVPGASRVDFYDGADAEPDSEPDTLAHAVVSVQANPAAAPPARETTSPDRAATPARIGAAPYAASRYGRELTRAAAFEDSAAAAGADLVSARDQTAELDGVIAIAEPSAGEPPLAERAAWYQADSAIEPLDGVGYGNLADIAVPFAEAEDSFASGPAFAPAPPLENEPSVTSFAEQLAAVALPYDDDVAGAPSFDDGGRVAAEDLRLEAEPPLGARRALFAAAPQDGGDQAEALIDELVAAGLSLVRARDFVLAAQTHELPFATSRAGSSPQRDLRDAVRSAIARSLRSYRGLPQDGALVALVGAGGSGKTRCAAAIAAAYGQASTLAARAVVLGRYDSGAELAGLLEPHGVAVQTAERGGRAAAALAASRDGEIVVADTPTVSPADAAGIGMLAVELGALRPEEVLLTLPATITFQAGQRLLHALDPLEPTALIVTHADEADALGVAVEVSLESGKPIAFIHRGLDMPSALAPTNPVAVAEALLP